MLQAVCTKWYDLGLELLDPKDEKELDIIGANSKAEGVRACCKNMFNKWLENESVTWDQLVKAVRKIGLKHAASEIEKLFESEVLLYL